MGRDDDGVWKQVAFYDCILVGGGTGLGDGESRGRAVADRVDSGAGAAQSVGVVLA